MDQPNDSSSVPIFADCSNERVFNEISAKITTSEARALWVRLQEEIRRQGVGASASYLGGEFTRLKEELTRELAAPMAS